MIAAAEARAHLAALRALGIGGAARDRLASYLGTLAVWNRRINLSGARSAEQRVGILVAPVVPVASGLAPGRLLDVGSGNGSPGLVLALLRPDLEVTLLEPRAKRWAFLREAARAAGRPEIEVLRTRIEGYDGPAVQTVTVRALRLPLHALGPRLRTGGCVVVFGSAPQLESGFERAASPARAVDIHVFRRLTT